MAVYDVFADCAQCSGTGIQPGGGGPGASGPETCTWPGCNGTGWYIIGHVDITPSTAELDTKLNDKFDEVGSKFDALDISLNAINDKLDDILDLLQP